MSNDRAGYETALELVTRAYHFRDLDQDDGLVDTICELSDIQMAHVLLEMSMFVGLLLQQLDEEHGDDTGGIALRRSASDWVGISTMSDP